jgi:MFS family permease
VTVSRRRTPLIALMSASGVSMTGDILMAIAIPWFVLQTTGSAAQTGLTAAVTALPTVIVGIFGGALVDRIGHRRTSIVSDIASGSTVALVPLLYLTVGIEFWQLLILMFVGGILDVPGRTARQSLLPELAGQSGTPLERANSAFTSLDRGATLIGPVLAGLLIAVMGPANVLFLNAGTFLVSAMIVSVFIPVPAREINVGATVSTYVRDLKEGFTYLAGERLTLTILVLAALINFFSNPMAAVILPVYADQVLGDSVQLGIVIGGFGAGALIGALLYGAFGHRFARRPVFVAALLMSVIPYGALVLQPGLIGAAAAMVAFGLAAGPLQPIAVTVIQQRTPTHLRARVFGLLAAGSWAMLPLGMLAAGFLIESAGLSVTLGIIGTAFLVVGNTALALPVLKQMDVPVTLTESEPEVSTLH